MFRPCSALSLAALAIVSLSASAQWTTSRITFRNAGSRSQADLEQATGMHAGAKASRADIQAAAQRLMDTGYFDDVKVDSKGAPAAMEITFILVPEAAAKETAAGFENFVWFTPEELKAMLHTAAPLFDGRLPEAGNQIDVIQAALQAALVAKGINRRVTNELLLPSSQRPFAVTDFRVEPSPRIAVAHVTGAPPEIAAAEETAAARLVGSIYSEGPSEDTTTNALLAPLRNAGYIDARLENLQRTVNSAGQVDVSAALATGTVYHVAAVNLPSLPANTPPSSALVKDPLHAGDIASRQRLLLTLQPIEAAYRKQGYMDVFIKPGETLDTSAHTVSYNPTVVPGEVYHLHSVTQTGLSPAAAADFDKAWRMKAGDVYDADYVSHLIENNSALRALGTYKATFKAEADPSTHLVDLTLKFVPSGIQARQ